MLEYKDGLVKRIAGKALRISWHGKTHLAVNSPFFASELGHELAKMSPSKIAVVWHRASDGIKVSLRSTGNVDVAKLAKKYGGGGHPKAAAFRIKKGETLPWKIIS
jgi:nanoRNase/pAp phosphatase (c-di-AMP/oligoRNAs hydrolase)